MIFRLIAKTTTVTIGACLLLAAPAFSEEESEFARNGFYLGANVIGGSYTRLESIDDDLEADPAPGFGLYGGYRLSPAVALEGQYQLLTKTDFDLEDGSGSSSEVDLWTFTGNVKIFLWPERFQPYALIGLGAMRADFDDLADLDVGGSETGFTFRFGAGLDFYITKHVVAQLGLSYLLPADTDLEKLDYVSYGGGVQYRF